MLTELMTIMGEAKYWEIEHVGERPVPGYVAHGNVWVDRESVVRSKLTEKGQRRLRMLADRVPTWLSYVD